MSNVEGLYSVDQNVVDVETPSTGAKETVSYVEPKLPATKIPSYRVRRTQQSLKKNKPLPIFVAGELFPLKGVWFQVVRFDEQGVLSLVVKTDEVKTISAQAESECKEKNNG